MGLMSCGRLLILFLYVWFCSFKKLCEEAFLKLRDSGPLFLNLFTMMMSCGIPELQTRDDISYIRYTRNPLPLCQ